jgi:MoaA/NifB/PqqE/SkfB family radical SAM enzyme
MFHKLTYFDKSKEDWFLVSWTLGNKCNYRCSYCPTFLHDGSAGWPDWGTVKDFVDNFILPGKEICFRISGGEPTYWKHFPELAKLVKERGNIFSYLTNGSQTVEYYQQLSKYTDGMILSYHPEYTKLDHFIDILQNVPGLKGVNVMITPENFDNMFVVAETLYNASPDVAIWPKIVLDKQIGSFTNEPGEFSTEQLRVLKNWKFLRTLKDQKLHRGKLLLNDQEISANELVISKKNDHRGWHCWGGLHGIAIDHWGDVYRSDCQYGDKLGNISQYVLPTAPVICGKEKCICLSDIYLKKEQPIT